MLQVELEQHTVFRPLTESEALALTNKIRTSVSSIREMLYEMYTRQGWRSMGYESWGAYLDGEFEGASTPYLRRQTNAALIEADLGVEIDQHKESHLRPLKETLLEQGDRQAAYRLALAIAETKGAEPIARDFQTAAWMVWVDRYGDEIIRERMVNGELSVSDAYKLAVKIGEYSEPEEMLAELAREISDPALMPIFDRLFKRNPVSETLIEIYYSRTIPAFPDPIPLKDAHASNLLAWLDYASAEHRAMSRKRNWGDIMDVMEEIVRLVSLLVPVVDSEMGSKLGDLLVRYRELDNEERYHASK